MILRSLGRSAGRWAVQALVLLALKTAIQIARDRKYKRSRASS
jgi:hypothetical protein